MKFIERRYRTYNNKNIETIMLEHREVLQLCKARKPDIVRYGPVTKSIARFIIICTLNKL